MSIQENNFIDENQYFLQLVKHFPDLREKIDSEDGVHFNMERFADYTIDQIKNGDIQELKHCFEFQENKIPFATPDIANAMDVSYCESLLCNVPEDMKIMTQHMGPNLLKQYKDYEAFYTNLGKKKDTKMTSELSINNLVEFVISLIDQNENDDQTIIEKIDSEFSFDNYDSETILELVRTGLFRASIIASGTKYPKNNLENDPIVATATKIGLAKLGRPEQYTKHKDTNKKWWKFW